MRNVNEQKKSNPSDIKVENTSFENESRQNLSLYSYGNANNQDQSTIGIQASVHKEINSDAPRSTGVSQFSNTARGTRRSRCEGLFGINRAKGSIG